MHAISAPTAQVQCDIPKPTQDQGMRLTLILKLVGMHMYIRALLALRFSLFKIPSVSLRLETSFNSLSCYLWDAGSILRESVEILLHYTTIKMFHCCFCVLPSKTCSTLVQKESKYKVFLYFRKRLLLL